MRTKHFLYSVAVAATLAACTQDGLEVVDNKAQDLSIRPELGKIELVENLDVNTRFATGPGSDAQPEFAEGDKLGACIMDIPNYPTTPYDVTDPASNYTIEEFYSSNNAFSLKGGVWTVDQPMVEGNYMFYAPYSPKMQLRTPFEVLVPATQDASTKKSALDKFYESGSVVRVGYQFLAAQGGVAQKPKVTMNDVFAYPMITINNKFNGYLHSKDNKLVAYNGEMKVDSIRLVVVGANNIAKQDVVIGGLLENNKVATAMKADGAWDKSPMENYTANLLKTNKLNDGSSKDRTGGFITTLLANKRAIAQNASEVFYAVMPAISTNTTDNKLQANIYVTIGEKQYVISSATLATPSTGAAVSAIAPGTQFESSVGTIKLIKGQKFPQEELNFEEGKLTAKPSAGTILTIELSGGKAAGKVQIANEITPDAVTLIDNNTQFINFFKEQLNGSALVEEGSTINGVKFAFSTNTTAKINSELIEALFTYNNKGTLKIDKALILDNDVKVKTIGTASGDYTPVTFVTDNKNEYTIQLKTATGGSYDNSVTGVLKSVVATKTLSIHVSATGTLTVGADLTAGNIRNDGTVTVSETISLTPTSFVNYGELNVAGTVANTVTNNGAINITEAAASVTVNAGKGSISLPKANAAASVTVSGGTQEGIYVLVAANDFTKAVIEAADKIAWINAVELNGSAAYSADILAAMKDIKTVYATGASFPAATVNMINKTLVLTGTVAKTISGNGLATSIVQNITILNAGSSDVTLSNIAVSGIYANEDKVTGKILADGTTATWNGAIAK